MKVDHPISPGDHIDNSQLCSIFGCSPQGGMRRSKKTNTLVLVSNHVKSVYEDRWLSDVFHYTGMGMTGDQSLNFGQNRTLAESDDNGVTIHLFEVFTKQQYVYVGRMRLAAKPYQEQQLDSEGNERQVWMFPLKIVEGKQPTVNGFVINELSTQKENAAERLSVEELIKRAKTAPAQAGSKRTETTQHDRNPWVSELAQRRANGYCQLCNKPAPFTKANGRPYLETHHIVWLSEGGEDTLANTVALCPNCHRKMHILGINTDLIKLKQAAKLSP